MPDNPVHPEQQSDKPASPGDKGQRLPPVRSDVDHFATCFICGQTFDLRDMDQVLHHAFGPHEPISNDASGD